MKYWKRRLRIPTHLRVKVKYVTNNPDEDTKLATVDRDLIEYDATNMEIYDEVFAAKDFKKEANKAVCHETLHLALHALIAYCNNMFTDEPGKQKELERLEEQTIATLEHALTEG